MGCVFCEGALGSAATRFLKDAPRRQGRPGRPKGRCAARATAGVCCGGVYVRRTPRCVLTKRAGEPPALSHMFSDRTAPILWNTPTPDAYTGDSCATSTAHTGRHSKARTTGQHTAFVRAHIAQAAHAHIVAQAAAAVAATRLPLLRRCAQLDGDFNGVRLRSVLHAHHAAAQVQRRVRRRHLARVEVRGEARGDLQREGESEGRETSTAQCGVNARKGRREEEVSAAPSAAAAAGWPCPSALWRTGGGKREAHGRTRERGVCATPVTVQPKPKSARATQRVHACGVTHRPVAVAGHERAKNAGRDHARKLLRNRGGGCHAPSGTQARSRGRGCNCHGGPKSACSVCDPNQRRA